MRRPSSGRPGLVVVVWLAVRTVSWAVLRGVATGVVLDATAGVGPAVVMVRSMFSTVMRFSN